MRDAFGVERGRIYKALEPYETPKGEIYFEDRGNQRYRQTQGARIASERDRHGPGWKTRHNTPSEGVPYDMGPKPERPAPYPDSLRRLMGPDGFKMPKYEPRGFDYDRLDRIMRDSGPAPRPPKPMGRGKTAALAGGAAAAGVAGIAGLAALQRKGKKKK